MHGKATQWMEYSNIACLQSCLLACPSGLGTVAERAPEQPAGCLPADGSCLHPCAMIWALRQSSLWQGWAPCASCEFCFSSSALAAFLLPAALCQLPWPTCATCMPGGSGLRRAPLHACQMVMMILLPFDSGSFRLICSCRCRKLTDITYLASDALQLITARCRRVWPSTSSNQTTSEFCGILSSTTVLKLTRCQ